MTTTDYQNASEPTSAGRADLADIDQLVKAKMARLDQVSLADVVDMLVDVQDALEEAKREDAFLRSYILARMTADNQTKLYHPAFEKIQISQKTERVINAPLLHQIILGLVEDGLIPPDLAKKAAWTVTVPAHVDYKTHATYIKKIEDHGDTVRAAIGKAIELRQNPPFLDFKRA